MVFRNLMDPYFFFLLVNLMCWLIELRWEWNSVRCSWSMPTWLSLTYLLHYLGGWGAVIKALSSKCSITKFAKTVLTGEHIGQPIFVCRECHQWWSSSYQAQIRANWWCCQQKCLFFLRWLDQLPARRCYKQRLFPQNCSCMFQCFSVHGFSVYMFFCKGLRRAQESDFHGR